MTTVAELGFRGLPKTSVLKIATSISLGFLPVGFGNKGFLEVPFRPLRRTPIMINPGLRHSAEQVGGLVFFGRMLDKIRLHAQGELPQDYKRGTGTDGRVCRFLHIDYPVVAERVLTGDTDAEVLAWCFSHGRKPNEEEVFTFNGFLSKRGWRDNQTEELEQTKRDRGFAGRTDIQTFFEFHKADEQED